jgi:hypothetical protein
MKQLAFLFVMLALTLCGPVFAQDSESGQTMLDPVSPASSFEPDAPATPAIIAAWVAVDAPLAKTPCFNCVNGKTKGTFGLSQPIAYIPTTFATLQLVFYYQDISFTGTCKVTLTIKQGKTTLLTLSNNVIGFNPSTVGFVFGQAKRPTASGAASLTGSVKCGTNPTASVTAPLDFQ